MVVESRRVREAKNSRHKVLARATQGEETAKEETRA